MSDNTNNPKHKADLEEAAKKIEAAIEEGKIFDAAVGNITMPADYFYSQAPEGITADYDRKSAAHRDLMFNAFSLATGRVAVKGFAQNSDLATVTAVMPVHKNLSIQTSWGRQGTSRNPGTGEVTTFAGALQVRKLEDTSSRTNAEIVAIKAEVRSLAAAAGL